MARALNARGIQTANGRQWYPTTVKNLLKRVVDEIASPVKEGQGQQ